MLGVAGQEESDEDSAVLLWNEYIARSTKLEKGSHSPQTPLSIFAQVTQCLIWDLSCCTKDADLKTEQFLSLLTALASDRRRVWDLQPIIGS